jgi:hypothetical protein
LRARAALLLLGVASGSFDLARAETAQTSETSSPRGRTDVEVYVMGSPEVFAMTRDTVRELFARLHIVPSVQASDNVEEAVIAGRSQGSAPLVRAILDMRSRASPDVLVLDGASHRVLQHRILPSSESLEVSVEEASHVIYGVVDSLLRSPPPPEPAGAPSSAQAPAGKPPSSAAFVGVDAGMFFSADAIAGSTIFYGAGAEVDLGLRRIPLRPSLRLSATLYAPAQEEIAAVDALVRPISFRLVPTIEWVRTPAIAGIVGAGGGLDWFQIDPGSSAPSGAQVADAAQNLDPVVAALVEARIRLRRGLDVLAGFELDVDCAPHRYVVEKGAERDALFLPSRLRPSFALGLSFPIVGPPHFEEPRPIEEATR